MTASRETLICDSSFVAHLPRRQKAPGRFDHWDPAVLARIRAANLAVSIVTIDNDLWIAATASVRERTLVTCDRDHLRIAGELSGEVLYLAPPV